MNSKIKYVAYSSFVLWLSASSGVFGVNSVSYYDDLFIKHKAISVDETLFFTFVSTWVDSKMDDKSDVYKETKLYIRPIQIHLNDKHIYSSPSAAHIFYRAPNK